MRVALVAMNWVTILNVIHIIPFQETPLHLRGWLTGFMRVLCTIEISSEVVSFCTRLPSPHTECPCPYL